MRIGALILATIVIGVALLVTPRMPTRTDASAATTVLSAPTIAIPTRSPRPLPTAPAPVDPPEPAPRSRLAVGEPRYIPILMYHYIRTIDADADPVGFRLSVRPDRFAEHLAWLRDHGYTTVPMQVLAACLRGDAACSQNTVALTFDDGYTDAVTEALPLLHAHGMVATFYIVTDFIGQPGYLTWEQVAELHAAGMEIGSHTRSHHDLSALPLETVRDELLGARIAIESQLGVPVLSLSYPAGSYTPEVAALAHELGYTSAVTTTPGTDLTDLYALPRRRVLGGETIAGYPWYFRPLP